MTHRMKCRLGHLTFYGFLITFLSGLVRDTAVKDAYGMRCMRTLSIRRPSSELFPFHRNELVGNRTHPLPAHETRSSPVRVVDSHSQYGSDTYSRCPLLHYCRNHRLVSSCADSRNVILFIVNFHNPFYSLLSFFEQSYFATFCRLFDYDFDFLFIGPHKGSECVLGNGLESKGYYSYMSMIRVWQYLRQSVSSYLGFYLMNDDSCLNPLLLNSFNFSESFTEGNGRYTIHSKWYWNHVNNNRNIPYPVAFTRAVHTIAKARPRYEECLKEENWKNGWSDAFYVTQRDVPEVQYFFNSMFNERVFLEMAVPTSMNCIGAKAIPSCNHNGNRSVLNYHMHPVKFSKEENRELCIGRMSLRSL